MGRRSADAAARHVRLRRLGRTAPKAVLGPRPGGDQAALLFEQPGLFAFASELQAFRQLDEFRPTVDLQAIDLYLHYQYIPALYSIFREGRKLPPARFLVVDQQGTSRGPTRYWDLEFRPDRSLDEAGWVERIDAALRETVSAHLVSDVPLGAFLSGGTDSSTVVAYMSRVLADPVKTFTIGHPLDDYDERRWARRSGQGVWRRLLRASR